MLFHSSTQKNNQPPYFFASSSFVVTLMDEEDPESAEEQLTHLAQLICGNAELIAIQYLKKRLDIIDINGISDVNGPPHALRLLSPLHMAAYAGMEKLLTFLLECPNINVNIAKATGLTPLILACKRGHHRIVRILLNDPRTRADIVTNNTETALSVTANRGDLRCLLELINGRPSEQLLINHRFKDYVSSANGPYNTGVTANELAWEMRKGGKSGYKFYKTLVNYYKEPTLTRHRTQLKLKDIRALCASLYAIMQSICSKYFETITLRDSTTYRQIKQIKFLKMTSQLPGELQMMVCSIVYDNNKSRYIKNEDSFPAWHDIMKFAGIFDDEEDIQDSSGYESADVYLSDEHSSDESESEDDNM